MNVNIERICIIFMTSRCGRHVVVLHNEINSYYSIYCYTYIYTHITKIECYKFQKLSGTNFKNWAVQNSKNWAVQISKIERYKIQKIERYKFQKLSCKNLTLHDLWRFLWYDVTFRPLAGGAIWTEPFGVSFRICTGGRGPALGWLGNPEGVPIWDCTPSAYLNNLIRRNKQTNFMLNSLKGRCVWTKPDIWNTELYFCNMDFAEQ